MYDLTFVVHKSRKDRNKWHRLRISLIKQIFIINYDINLLLIEILSKFSLADRVYLQSVETLYVTIAIAIVTSKFPRSARSVCFALYCQEARSTSFRFIPR